MPVPSVAATTVFKEKQEEIIHAETARPYIAEGVAFDPKQALRTMSGLILSHRASGVDARTRRKEPSDESAK